MNQINKSYYFAMKCFEKECQKQIGIKPIDDDKLILKSAIDFGTYIKSFKRLDHSVVWQRTFINSMVKSKVDTLSNRIKEKYGTHKKYISRL